jgi:hypothetical protein
MIVIAKSAGDEAIRQTPSGLLRFARNDDA